MNNPIKPYKTVKESFKQLFLLKKTMSKRVLFLLSIISGLLFALSWPADGFPFLLFVAFVPILWVEHEIFLNKINYGRYLFFGYSFLAFLIWNAATTWWIVNATIPGSVTAILLNSFFMALVMQVFHISKRNLPKQEQAYFGFIIYWISFEYLHLNWELSWPWLHLGNGFAHYTKCIQWYEFTGILGGTLWILIVNLLSFHLLKNIIFRHRKKSYNTRMMVFVAVFLLTPLVISYFLNKKNINHDHSVAIVIVQPGFNSYSKKQGELSDEVQMQRILKLAKKEIDENTDFLVLPEDALPGKIVESKALENENINCLIELLKEFPTLNIIAGAKTKKYYKTKAIASPTAQKGIEENLWYDTYNSAIFLKSNNEIHLYHKSKLVAGIEKEILPWFNDLFPNLMEKIGASTFSYGTQLHRKVFKSSNGIKVATSICYESVYGDFTTKYVLNGAEVFFIITNDGWWGNSPGYKQHLQYSRLRAVETRKSIARAAYNGISCFIDPKGNIIESSEWEKKAVLSHNMPLNNKISFYVKYGDFLGRILTFFGILMLLYVSTRILINKRK